jgi:hypothetical protein
LSAEELDELGDQMTAAQAELLLKNPRKLAKEQTDEAAPLSETR